MILWGIHPLFEPLKIDEGCIVSMAKFALLGDWNNVCNVAKE